MKVRVEVTQTITGVVDADQIVSSWPGEFKQFCETADARDLAGDDLAEAFVRQCAKEVGGKEILDDFSSSYDTEEDTSLVRLEVGSGT